MRSTKTSTVSPTLISAGCRRGEFAQGNAAFRLQAHVDEAKSFSNRRSQGISSRRAAKFSFSPARFAAAA
jgi:hypothetical protein